MYTGRPVRLQAIHADSGADNSSRCGKLYPVAVMCRGLHVYRRASRPVRLQAINAVC